MSLMHDRKENFKLQVSENPLRDDLGRFIKGHICLNKKSIIITCDYCGKSFERTPLRMRASNYCCRSCYIEARRSKMVKRPCKICGKTIRTSHSRIKDARGKYCSVECYREAQRNKTYEPHNKGKSLEETVGEQRALEVKKRLSSITKTYWKKPDYVKKQMKARNARPNHQEKFMVKCFPFLQYVGDGALVIGGKCPDFKVKDQKKLVELFGNYWHDIDEEGERISHFKKYGWSCVVVWDSELKTAFPIVADKLNDFVGKSM